METAPVDLEALENKALQVVAEELDGPFQMTADGVALTEGTRAWRLQAATCLLAYMAARKYGAVIPEVGAVAPPQDQTHQGPGPWPRSPETPAIRSRPES